MRSRMKAASFVPLMSTIKYRSESVVMKMRTLSGTVAAEPWLEVDVKESGVDDCRCREVGDA